jgi:acetyl-CoA synthetase
LRAARDFLLAHRSDYATARAKFEWPCPDEFNFAIDWFDAVLAAEHADRAVLRLIEPDGSDASYTFGELSRRSDQLAGWLRAWGLGGVCACSSCSATRWSCGSRRWR